MTLAARRVLSTQLRRLRSHDPGTREGSDPEELHDMRVATRRMRAALRTYGPALPRSIRRRLVEDLRWLGRRLGAVRDLDVLLERFVASRADPRLLQHLRSRRGAARDRMLPALRSRRYLRLVSTLDAVCRGWSVEPLPGRAFEPAALHAAARARRALDRLVREGDAAMERPEAARLHETRIRAKRLRYILEFHREAGGAPCGGMIRRLKAAQDHLGAHQDAVVAEAEVRAFVGSHGAALDDAARAAARDAISRLEAEALALRRRWRGRWRRLRAALTGPPGRAALLALGEKKGDARAGVP
jgi:CHAD domain-containing protein